MYATGQPPAPLPTLLTSLSAAGEAQGDAKARAAARAVKPRPAVAHLEDLPEEFPDDLIVRNTFIDSAALLSPSLEGFYRHREVQTCPSSLAGRLLQGPLFQDPAWLPGPAQVLGTVPCSPLPAAPAAAAACPPTCAPAAATWEAAAAPPPPQPIGAGSPLPSAGSALHACGQCKPCGFFHGKGCDNGAACTFCHLCPPGEKRRRQKERFAHAALLPAAAHGTPGAPQKPRRASVA